MITVHYVSKGSGIGESKPAEEFEGYEPLAGGILKVWKGPDRRLLAAHTWEWVQLEQQG